jgi:hypothetical protein
MTEDERKERQRISNLRYNKENKAKRAEHQRKIAPQLRAYRKAWRAKNRDRCHAAEQKRATKFERRLNHSIGAAKVRNLEFTLSEEECRNLIEMPCYYCNNELGEKTMTSLGLDRLDPKLGYVSGNCVSCCKICNFLKSDRFTPEETKAAVDAILAHRRSCIAS